MKRARTNGTLAAGLQTTDPTAASWDAFDALPRPIRALLWSAPQPIAPLDVRNLIATYGVGPTRDALMDAIRKETMIFGIEHRERHGAPLPHLAAEATTQPYGTSEPTGPAHEPPLKALKRFSRTRRHPRRRHTPG